jgi:hypothetical protein
VAVVDERAANEIFAGDAVGRTIVDPSGRRVEVIGVISRRGETTPPEPTIFYYEQQTGIGSRLAGPAAFRVPVTGQPTRAVLDTNVVSASYFETMGLKTIAGTIFSDGPASGACRVGVVNDEAAELYFDGDAVGGAVIDSIGRRTEIAGVVQSARLRASQRRPEPTLYIPMLQEFLPRMTLILQAGETNESMLTELGRRLDAVPGGIQGGARVTTLEAHLGRTALSSERIALVLVSAAAAIGLALGLIGLYGAMAEAVRLRRRELAVRIALGAPRWRVIRGVLSEAARFAFAGAAAGVLASLLLESRLAQAAPGAGSASASTWLAGPLLLLVVAAVASVIPARRALGVDPLAVMREE